MDDVKVSVIIPTYKRTEDITRAVESVLAQTLFDVEVIVVDDNGIGTECGIKTQEAMRCYEGNDRVVYIQHDVNKNGSAARNTGIRAARGEYIAFLDDDDVYRPERLEKMCNKMDSLSEEWGACYTGYVKHQADGSEQYSFETVEGDVLVQALMRSFYIGTGSNLFFRRSVVENVGFFNETFKRNQDLEYIIRVLKKYKIAYLDDVLVDKYVDIITAYFTLDEQREREMFFRKNFQNYVNELPEITQREIEIMWDIDWMRTLFSYKSYGQIIKMLLTGKVPLKILFQYFRYAFDRRKNKTSYGFVVKLK